MNQVHIYLFANQQIRTIQKQGELWFVLRDVCRILDITNNRNVTVRLDEDEKTDVGIMDTSSNGTTQSRSVTIINESGLYNVILVSRKPQAKAFKRWLTHEVLPSIRKTGKYAINPEKMTAFQIATIHTREENLKIQKAKELARLAAKYKGTPYEKVLDSYATKERTGKYLIPLPVLKEINGAGDNRPYHSNIPRIPIGELIFPNDDQWDEEDRMGDDNDSL